MCDSILEATLSPKSKKDAMMSAPGEGAYQIEISRKKTIHVFEVF